MSKFDPTRPLIMASFKHVDGFGVPAGTPLVIVDTPAKTGEVTEFAAGLLFSKGIAVYNEDFRPTPVETEAQARAREAAEALRDAIPSLPDGVEVTDQDITDELQAPDDLLIWQEDDADLGKKAGDRVTKEDLVTIAFREEAVIDESATKPVIIRQIVEHRAAQAG